MNVVVEVESGVVEVVVVSYKCKGLVEAGSAMEVVVEVNLAAGMGEHNIVVVVVDSKLVGAGVMVKGEEEEVSKLVGVVAGVKE